MSKECIEKFTNCMLRLDHMNINKLHIPEPRDVLPNPSKKLKEKYILMRNVWDDYMANLGAEAYEHVETLKDKYQETESQ